MKLKLKEQRFDKNEDIQNSTECEDADAE